MYYKLKFSKKTTQNNKTPVPEIIDPVFAKTNQNACFLVSENERFWLVFVKTGSINSGTGKAVSLRANSFFKKKRLATLQRKLTF